MPRSASPHHSQARYPLADLCGAGGVVAGEASAGPGRTGISACSHPAANGYASRFVLNVREEAPARREVIAQDHARRALRIRPWRHRQVANCGPGHHRPRGDRAVRGGCAAGTISPPTTAPRRSRCLQGTARSAGCPGGRRIRRCGGQTRRSPPRVLRSEKSPPHAGSTAQPLPSLPADRCGARRRTCRSAGRPRWRPPSPGPPRSWHGVRAAGLGPAPVGPGRALLPYFRPPSTVSSALSPMARDDLLCGRASPKCGAPRPGQAQPTADSPAGPSPNSWVGARPPAALEFATACHAAAAGRRLWQKRHGHERHEQDGQDGDGARFHPSDNACHHPVRPGDPGSRRQPAGVRPGA